MAMASLMLHSPEPKISVLRSMMRPRRFGVAVSIDVSVVAVSAAVSMVFSIESLE